MRRGVKEVHSSGIGGGLEGGVVTRTRPKVEKSLHTKPREASVVGSFHAPRLADRGDNSPTWVETNLTSPKQVVENLHKEGKVKLREEKVYRKGNTK